MARFSPNHISKISSCGLLFILFVALTSCSQQPKANLIPAKGTVLINGQPAANIMVQCSPKTLDEEVVAPTSQGLSDESGNFILLTTKNENGALPGIHNCKLFDILEDRPAQGEESTSPSRLASRFSNKGVEIEIVAGKEVIIEAVGPE